MYKTSTSSTNPTPQPNQHNTGGKAKRVLPDYDSLTGLVWGLAHPYTLKSSKTYVQHFNLTHLIPSLYATG